MKSGANGTASIQAPALEARNLYRFYRAGEEETLALHGVSLKVEPGTTVAVLGPSGSGKSTLLRCLAGLDEPAGGTVFVRGEQVSHRPEAERARIRARRIGVLLQTGNLLQHLDVRGNVRMAQLASGTEAPRRRADELIERVGLAARRHAYPAELSGGELAHAGLAVALANDPDVVLADEPTGELDGDTEQQLLRLLGQHTGRGAGLVVVTHSPEVACMADRVLTWTDGQIRHDS
jgi:putative ABC transport system ATP-binding protein